MLHGRLALAAFALLYCAACRKQNTTYPELRHAEELAAQAGPSAARDYLLSLPLSESPGEERRYRRMRALVRFEESLGLWHEAEQHLREGLEVSRRTGNAKQAAQIEVIRARFLIQMNQLDQAARALDSAQVYASAIHDTSLDRYILHNRGKLLEASGRFEEAIPPTQRSLALFEQSKEFPDAANVRITLAWALYQMGRYDQAREQYDAAERTIPENDRHLCWGHKGNLEYEQRNYEKAAELYRKASENAKRSDPNYQALWLADEATAWIELRDWQRAAECNRLAMTVGQKLPVVTDSQHVLVNEARIAAGVGETGQAVTQLLTLVKSAKDPVATLDASAELIGLYQQAGEDAKARTVYDDGLSLVDRQRAQLRDIENKLAFEASAMHLNQRYIDGLMAGQRAALAFEAAEAGRARMLRGNFNLLEAPGRRTPLAGLQAVARRSDTAYLAYWVAPERSFLWVISAGRFSWHILPGESVLRRRIERYQQALEERADSAAGGADLFHLLIEPALADLHGVDRFIIVPDGPLYGMNFETLRQGAVDAPYWIESATLSIAPSLTLLLDGSVNPATGSSVLLMGDASEWNADFPKLLNSAAELDLIETHFPAARRVRLTQAGATPAAFERQAAVGHRFIHFATHAAANRAAPLESAIILSQANGRGVLTARDVLAMPLNTELVSISACRSAGARTYAGEGLVGLAWAFLHSGAHSVVAGLWDVDDYSSPALMSSLYAGLAKGMTAADALRSAKLKLLQPGQKFSDPYYWGPFLLYQGAGSS